MTKRVCTNRWSVCLVPIECHFRGRHSVLNGMTGALGRCLDQTFDVSDFGSLFSKNPASKSTRHLRKRRRFGTMRCPLQAYPILKRRNTCKSSKHRKKIQNARLQGKLEMGERKKNCKRNNTRALYGSLDKLVRKIDMRRKDSQQALVRIIHGRWKALSNLGQGGIPNVRYIGRRSCITQTRRFRLDRDRFHESALAPVLLL